MMSDTPSYARSSGKITFSSRKKSLVNIAFILTKDALQKKYINYINNLTR